MLLISCSLGTGSCDHGGVASPNSASRPAGWTPREQMWRGSKGHLWAPGEAGLSSVKAFNCLAAAHSCHTGQSAVVNISLLYKMRHSRVSVWPVIWVPRPGQADTYRHPPQGCALTNANKFQCNRDTSAQPHTLPGSASCGLAGSSVPSLGRTQQFGSSWHFSVCHQLPSVPRRFWHLPGGHSWEGVR